MLAYNERNDRMNCIVSKIDCITYKNRNRFGININVSHWREVTILLYVG